MCNWNQFRFWIILPLLSTHGKFEMFANVTVVSRIVSNSRLTLTVTQSRWQNPDDVCKWFQFKNQPGTAQVGVISKAKKIAKGLQSVRYSLLQYQYPHEEKNRKKIFECFSKFLRSTVSRIVPKNLKGGLLGFFEHPFFCKMKKIEEGPFGRTHWKKLRKKSPKAEITCTTKLWSRARLEPTYFCLADLKKSQLTSMHNLH